MKYYKDFADFLAEHFDGKMQKLSVNAGFTCPNRDGTIGTGGCIYCDNSRDRWMYILQQSILQP